MVQYIPEEYPGLPQEADITCLKNCFRVEGCPRLASLTIGADGRLSATGMTLPIPGVAYVLLAEPMAGHRSG